MKNTLSIFDSLKRIFCPFNHLRTELSEMEVRMVERVLFLRDKNFYGTTVHKKIFQHRIHNKKQTVILNSDNTPGHIFLDIWKKAAKVYGNKRQKVFLYFPNALCHA